MTALYEYLCYCWLLFLYFSNKGRKGVHLTTHSTHLVTVIWRRTYGKGPLRWQERKPAVATWATLSD